VEETPQGARATVIVPAGEKVSTTIEWRMAESETQAIADIDDTVILQWLDEGPSPEIASKLQGLVTARKAQKEAERDLSTVMQAIEDATSESSRISGLLSSVGDTPLKQQFLQDLTEQEKSIKALRAQRNEARDRLEKLRKELGEAIARL
jgi:macrodomain Ter protein organizer (MatP/YcbG family)